MKWETSECKYFERSLRFYLDVQAKQVIIACSSQSPDRAQTLCLFDTFNSYEASRISVSNSQKQHASTTERFGS